MSSVYLFPCLSRHVKGKEKASEASSFNIVLASRCCIPVGTCPGRLITHNRDAIKPHVLSDNSLQRANHGVYAPAIVLEATVKETSVRSMLFGCLPAHLSHLVVAQAGEWLMRDTRPASLGRVLSHRGTWMLVQLRGDNLHHFSSHLLCPPPT